MGASKELKEIVIESGHMAESLFERVNTGYDELTVSRIFTKKKYTSFVKNTEKKMFLQQEIKGLSNLEKVLLETADSVMDTRKKLEFGVQQIMFKVSLI